MPSISFSKASFIFLSHSSPSGGGISSEKPELLARRMSNIETCPVSTSFARLAALSTQLSIIETRCLRV